MTMFTRVGPLSLERFLGYADWFTDQLVPDVQDLTVTNVTPVDGGFTVDFAEEPPAFARQVIDDPQLRAPPA